VSYTKVKEAARVLGAGTRIISLEPTSLEEIIDNILLVGKTTGKLERAQELGSQLLSRINAVKSKTRNLRSRPRVFFMEWLQPPWAGGHWIPQMVDYAGGVEGLGRLGKPSHRIEWSEVLDYQPEIIVLSPCGFDLNGVMGELHELESYRGWDKIPAYKSHNIYAVNASAYFSRPGPRIVDGLELLAHIIHPEVFPETRLTGEIKQVDVSFLKS
jgi:iron complex transport system substrate-binding protein